MVLKLGEVMAFKQGEYPRLVTSEDLPLHSLSNGGGGGTSDDMEGRVAQLEADMREAKLSAQTIREMLIRIEGKLDTKSSAEAVAEIKGKLDGKASAAELGNLSGKIDDRPTTWKGICSTPSERGPVFGHSAMISG